MRRACRVALYVGFGSLALTGCGSGRGNNPRTTGGLVVPVRVYRSGAAAAALVRLAIEGHAYYFLLDTGAERTIIDTRVARELRLRDDGSPREFFPLGCKVSSQPVLLQSWALGNRPLPVTTAFTQKLLIPRAFSRLPLGGLLGADLLSRFGTVTIDFGRRRLTLGGKPPTGGDPVAVQVLRADAGVVATTEVRFDNRRVQFLVDTGATHSVIDATAATRFRLKPAAPAATIPGAVCRRDVTPVLVHAWSFAGLHFSEAIIGRITRLLPPGYLQHGITGILGTETLARLGTLTIDFTRNKLILGGTVR